MTKITISTTAKQILQRESEIAASLIEAATLPPFLPSYRPAEVELLLDDLPYIRTIHGEPVYIRPCQEDLNPRFWELKLDGTTALFVIGNEVIINRIENLASSLIELGLIGIPDITKVEGE